MSWDELDIIWAILLIEKHHVLIVCIYLLILLFLWILTHSTIVVVILLIISRPFAFLDSFILLQGKLPSFLLKLVLFMFFHVQWLIVPSCQLFLRSKFVLYGLVDPGATASPFNIGGVEVAHIRFLVGDSILIGVFLWTCEYPTLLYLWMIESVAIVSSAIISEVVLSSRDLWGKVLGFSIVPRPIRQEVLLVERIRLVVCQLVISHNKIMKETSYKLLHYK